ncbi:MAG: class I SAM-dependent methyltransferase [Halieaceae bacterium]|nr:class I SAM-dependent methyltransferase [Halieaceae bacterium]
MKGSDYYERNAEALADRYDGIDAERLHESWSGALDSRPAGLACDIGAGSGRDARWLAKRGWEVVAVEPSAAMRRRGTRATEGLAVTWVDDALPALASLRGSTCRFDLITLLAVWQHLEAVQRVDAFDTVSSLLRPGGLVVLTLRHGHNAAENRERGFHPVSSDEVLALAGDRSLILEGRDRRRDLTRADVEWETLLLEHHEAAKDSPATGAFAGS